MASVKIVLRKKKNKDGAYPLAIRITKDRRSSFVHLGKYLSEDQWEPKEQRVHKSHPNYKRLNNYLIKKLSEANDMALELETQASEASSYSVKQKIKPRGSLAFFTQADLYLRGLKKTGKYNQYTADKPRIKHFKEFLNGQEIAFSDITVFLLERFKGYLKGTQKVGDRTIMNHLVVIRSVFSRAIKDSVTDRKYYPFGAGKIRIKFPESLKIGLSPEEVRQLENVVLTEDSFENHARNLWLFAFYLAGMRVSDVLRLKWSDIQNQRLHYAMGKNTKPGSLKLPEKALAILEQYQFQKKGKEDLIFPDLKRLETLDDKFIVQRTIAFTVSRIDKFLNKKVAPKAKIYKPLTMHIARHTFGNISGDRIPIQMLQRLYRHSSIITTVGYQANFIHKDADAALDSVLAFGT